MTALRRIASSIISAALRIILLAFVVMFVYRYSLVAYDFGYRIFAEEPVSMGSGRDVEVTIPMGKGALEIGEILEENGLIRDSKLFFCQELLSAYHGKLQSGFYTFNTSMSAAEMMAKMAESSDDEGEEDGSEEN